MWNFRSFTTTRAEKMSEETKKFKINMDIYISRAANLASTSQMAILSDTLISQHTGYVNTVGLWCMGGLSARGGAVWSVCVCVLCQNVCAILMLCSETSVQPGLHIFWTKLLFFFVLLLSEEKTSVQGRVCCVCEALQGKKLKTQQVHFVKLFFFLYRFCKLPLFTICRTQNCKWAGFICKVRTSKY